MGKGDSRSLTIQKPISSVVWRYSISLEGFTYHQMILISYSIKEIYDEFIGIRIKCASVSWIVNRMTAYYGLSVIGYDEYMA